MKDRTSKYPGRVQLVPVEGMANTYTMAWADEPQQEGTPLNKATLLSDTVAAALRLSQEDPTVSDALAGIASGFARVITETRDPTIDDEGLYGWLWINTSGGSYKISVCFGNSAEGYQWASFLSAKRTLKSEVFTSSGTFTLPDTALGDVHIWVYGGGGSGSSGFYKDGRTSGGGGAGGYMSEWTGSLEAGKNYSVTVGDGGAATSSSNGNAGGASSFDTIVSAQGGSGASSLSGGNGGSGGGGGYSDGYLAVFGAGSQFGSGGGTRGWNDTTAVTQTNGVNTNTLDIPNIAKGTGAAGSSGSKGGGGGGGYGGNGGNGSANGGGGGGGFGASGNGGNGATANADPSGAGNGGYGAGGGGCNYYGISGSGGSGIVVVAYYVMEVVA